MVPATRTMCSPEMDRTCASRFFEATRSPLPGCGTNAGDERGGNLSLGPADRARDVAGDTVTEVFDRGTNTRTDRKGSGVRHKLRTREKEARGPHPSKKLSNAKS